MKKKIIKIYGSKNESDKHIKLKEFAIELLRLNGFSNDEIFVEHAIYDKNTWYRVDVAGVKKHGFLKGLTVAIEVGSCSKSKLDILNKFCYKVIHIPYSSSNLDYSIDNFINDEQKRIFKEKNDLDYFLIFTYDKLCKIYDKICDCYDHNYCPDFLDYKGNLRDCLNKVFDEISEIRGNRFWIKKNIEEKIGSFREPKIVPVKSIVDEKHGKIAK